MRVLILFFLVSCGSTMITEPVTSEYAPEGYKDVGTVRYSTSGLGFIVQQKRESAFRKMYEVCNGKYKIVNEEIMSGKATSSKKYIYLHFQCL